MRDFRSMAEPTDALDDAPLKAAVDGASVLDLPAHDVADDAFAHGDAKAAAEMSHGLKRIRAARRRKRPGVGLTTKLTEGYGDQIQRKWALKIGAFIESNRVQIFIMVLFLIDIAIVLTELILETEIAREQAAQCRSDARTVANKTTCVNGQPVFPELHEESKKLHQMELAERILHWISVSLLCVFLLELLLLIFVFGKFFLKHVLYVVDFCIVSASLGLELGLKTAQYQDAAAVIIFLRLWRLVRAGHGILALAQERHEEGMHKMIVKNALLESDVREYQMEQAALERLLDDNGIEHPNFTSFSSKVGRARGMRAVRRHR